MVEEILVYQFMPLFPQAMIQQLQSSGSNEPKLPSQIRLAFEFVSHCHSKITDPPPLVVCDATGNPSQEKAEPRCLDPQERMAFNSALTLLNQYFNLEQFCPPQGEDGAEEEVDARWVRNPYEEGVHVMCNLANNQLRLVTVQRDGDSWKYETGSGIHHPIENLVSVRWLPVRPPTQI